MAARMRDNRLYNLSIFIYKFKFILTTGNITTTKYINSTRARSSSRYITNSGLIDSYLQFTSYIYLRLDRGWFSIPFGLNNYFGGYSIIKIILYRYRFAPFIYSRQFIGYY